MPPAEQKGIEQCDGQPSHHPVAGDLECEPEAAGHRAEEAGRRDADPEAGRDTRHQHIRTAANPSRQPRRLQFLHRQHTPVAMEHRPGDTRQPAHGFRLRVRVVAAPLRTKRVSDELSEELVGPETDRRTQAPGQTV